MKDLNVNELLQHFEEDPASAEACDEQSRAFEELVRRARAYDRLIKESPITKTTWKH